MRKINKIIIHCSATKADQDINAAIIRSWHKAAPRKWSDIGYHFVIKRDGTIEAGRPLERSGAHCKGHNSNSIGICLVGGLNGAGGPENNFTDTQFNSLKLLVDGLCFKFGITEVKGHRDYSPDKNKDGKITKDEWVKVCPCFDVGGWYYGTGTKEATVRKPKVEESQKNGMVKLSTNVGGNSNSNSKDSKSSRKRKSRRSSNNSTDD